MLINSIFCSCVGAWGEDKFPGEAGAAGKRLQVPSFPSTKPSPRQSHQPTSAAGVLFQRCTKQALPTHSQQKSQGFPEEQGSFCSRASPSPWLPCRARAQSSCARGSCPRTVTHPSRVQRNSASRAYASSTFLTVSLLQSLSATAPALGLEDEGQAVRTGQSAKASHMKP